MPVKKRVALSLTMLLLPVAAFAQPAHPPTQTPAAEIRFTTAAVRRALEASSSQIISPPLVRKRAPRVRRGPTGSGRTGKIAYGVAGGVGGFLGGSLLGATIEGGELPFRGFMIGGSIGTVVGAIAGVKLAGR